jgi:hypothetical protein
MSIFNRKEPKNPNDPNDPSSYFARQQSFLSAVVSYSGGHLKDTLDDKLAEQLKYARICAINGMVEHMDDSLESAKKYAAKLGKDISPKISELEKIGYTNAIPLEMKIIRENWPEKQDGLNYDYIHFALDSIKKYGAKIGKDVNAEVKELEDMMKQQN